MSGTNIPAQHTLTLLLEREQERFTQLGASFPGFNPNQRQKITNYGRVVEYRSKFLDKWALSTSLRHDDNDEFENQTTYRIGINYFNPETDFKLYLAHATGAKNPSFTEIFGFAPNNFIGNLDLEPEQSESWELGFSQILPNTHAQIQVALFTEDLIDEIQTIFLPTFESTVINNDSRSERDGLELAIYNQFSNNLSATASYTYVNAREPDNSGRNRTEIRRPKHQWNGQLKYRFLNENATLNVNINHIGDRRDIDFSTGNRVTLDDYTLVNFALSYQLHTNAQFFMRLNNVLDEEYEDVFGFETEKFSGFVGFEFRL